MADAEDLAAIRLALGNPSATVEEICARLRRMTGVEEALVFALDAGIQVMDGTLCTSGAIVGHHHNTGPSIIDALIRAKNEASK